MAAMTASVLNNFADLALSLPAPSLETTVKQNPAIVDSTGYDGRTALQKAVMIGNLPVVRLLLQYGADPNLRSQAGETAVHIACCRGLLNVFVTLLKHGGDPAVPDAAGRLSIHCAAISGSLLLVQYLAEVCEVNLEAEDGHGSSPLHTAASCGHLGLVEYLVNTKKVNRTCVDREGNTTLHAAARGGVSGVGWNVLYRGGEQLLAARNHDGLTPTQLAHATTSVSPDCRRWYDRWNRQYERSGGVESPNWPWLLQLATPAALFYASMIVSMLAVPHHQWTVSLPVFIVTLTVMARQTHRIKHPIRWPNPIYLGAYSAGLFTTLACYVVALEAPLRHPHITFIILSLTCLHLVLFYKLIRGDPGTVRGEGPLQEVLRGVGEGVVRGYCSECQLAAPPLSHHCKLCCACYHQTDHHCLFLNICVAANNHRRFVIFIFTNIGLMIGFLYTACSLVTSEALKQSAVIDPANPAKAKTNVNEDWIDTIVAIIAYLMNDNMWTFLLILCNVASLIWAFHLIYYQYNVIGSQQTTLCRLKLGNPLAKVTRREKFKNFWTFLVRGRVPLTNQIHYFNQV